MSNSIKLYPNPIGDSGSMEPVLGICFSGGGTRAMSCTLGQLSALTTLPDPVDSSKTLIDRASFISSVSGGTWGSVPYVYLPEKINRQPVKDADILISPQAPQNLYKGTKRDEHVANMSFMANTCLGKAPDNFTPVRILLFLKQWIEDAAENDLPLSQLWTEIVSAFILEQFDLSSLSYTNGTNLPEKFYSQSADYVQENILPLNKDLSEDDFYYPRSGRPVHIANYNLLQDIRKAPQIPVQATPINTGIPGQTPDGTLTGGGACESFGFASILTGGTTQTATADINRRYSLCDTTACSSAFYAHSLQKIVSMFLENAEKDFRQTDNEERLMRKYALRKQSNVPEILDKIIRLRQILKEQDYFALVPQYLYWPLDAVTTGGESQNYGFSDGGTFENTGLLGLLAQTTGDIKALAFVNSELPLSFSESHKLIADEQLTRLFGYKGFSERRDDYPSYGGLRPDEPMSYAQLFSDDNGEFNDLLSQLESNSCDGTDSLGQNVAWARQTLTTIDNPVAAITAGRSVEVIWVYNTPNARWQNQITDADILADLKDGQAEEPIGELKNFPNYSTFFQFHLENYAVNVLAQLKAWEVNELYDNIADMLTN